MKDEKTSTQILEGAVPIPRSAPVLAHAGRENSNDDGRD